MAHTSLKYCLLCNVISSKLYLLVVKDANQRLMQFFFVTNIVLQSSSALPFPTLKVLIFFCSFSVPGLFCCRLWFGLCRALPQPALCWCSQARDVQKGFKQLDRILHLHRSQEDIFTNDTNIAVLLNFVQERSRKPANLLFFLSL